MKKIRTIFLTILTMFFSVVFLSSCNSQGNTRLSIVHFDQSILGENQKDLSVSIGIKKGNYQLQEDINSVLASIDTETRNEMMTEAVMRSSGEKLESDGEILYQAPYDENKPTLTVGLECNYSPFNWTETTPNAYTYPIKGKNNEYADGYDVQIAKMIASSLSYNLVIEKMEWDALIPALQAGTINAVIAGMTDTEERRQSIDFTDPYYTSELVLIVRESDQDLANATELEAFAGKKIVSQISTVTDSIIDDWVTKYNVIHNQPLKTFADAAVAVQSGDADAMTAELPVATSIIRGSNVEMSSFDKIVSLLSNYSSTFIDGVAATLILSIVGTGVGLILGMFLALIKTIKIKENEHFIIKGIKKFFIGLASLYINIVRGTPMMVQAMIFYFGFTALGLTWSNITAYWIFNGAMYCGLIVITLNTAAYMAENVRAGLNGVDIGQEEGARSLGMSYPLTMKTIILPQAVRNALPTILNEFIVNIKDSSVLNVIGLTELYASVTIATNNNYFKIEGYIIIAVIYFVLTLIFSAIFKMITNKMDGKKINFFRAKHGHKLIEENDIIEG